MAAVQSSSSLHELSLRVAQRALDLARDPGVSRADGTLHLLRLARDDPSALQLALAALRRAPSTTADREHACLLLEAGIAGTSAAPRHSTVDHRSGFGAQGFDAAGR